MPRVETPVNPKILVWARETLGYDLETVAQKLKDKKENIEAWRERLKAWEEGTDNPTFSQLEHLAGIYQQPLIVFFHDQPPKEPELPTDYRRFPSGSPKPLDPQTKTSIWKAQWRQSVAESLRKEMGVEIIFQPWSEIAEEDAEELAFEARNYLRPQIEVKREWAKDSDQLFKRWRAILEKIGILVFRFNFPRDDARAFSLSGELAPIITVSSKDFYNAQIFSLFHELAHLLLSQSGTCNDLEFRTEPTTELDRVEIFCNHFAGAFLVPRNALLDHPMIKNKYYRALDDSNIHDLAKYFGVSHEVVLRRLVFLTRLDADFYKQWRKQQENYWKEAGQPKGNFGVEHSYVRKILSSQGQAYIETVLSAYSENLVNLSEVSEYLSVKVKHVSEIQEFLYEGGID